MAEVYEDKIRRRILAKICRSLLDFTRFGQGWGRAYKKDTGGRIKDEGRREPLGNRRESEKYVEEKRWTWKKSGEKSGSTF